MKDSLQDGKALSDSSGVIERGLGQYSAPRLWGTHGWRARWDNTGRRSRVESSLHRRCALIAAKFSF